MELSVVAVLVLALEVIDAVGHVAGLLDFSHETSCADGVDSASGDEEAVVFLHLVLCEGVGDGVVLHHLLVLLGCDLHLQTVVELGVGVTGQSVPHLSLAALLALLAGNLVVGVYLDGEVAVGVDELDEQWKLVAEALVVLRAEEAVLQFSHHLVEVLALILTVGNDRFVTLHAGDFPALAHVLLLDVEVLERNNLIATPDGGLQQRLEF